MENSRKILIEAEGRQVQKPINVPVIRPSVSAYTAALHMSLIAFALMASIFVIAFATFSSANAFNISHDTSFGVLSKHSSTSGTKLKFGLTVDKAQKHALPNVEETAFKSLIILNRVAQAKKNLTKPLPPKSFQIVATNSIAASRSLSSATRYIIAGFLGGMFAFMIWITARMWREFAGNSNSK